MRWGLSILDFHHHAINERGNHPTGVYKAECGHLLMMVTPLHEEPYGRLCGACAAIQAGRAVTRHDSDRLPVSPISPAPLTLPAADRPQLIGFRLPTLRGKGYTMTVCLPVTEVISIDAMASVDTVVWWCRLCDHHGTTTTRPTAHSEGIEHLTTQHHATIGTPE